jgi:hypothetical protein
VGAAEQESKAAVKSLQAQYSDIQQNFDPSVVPLWKKRTIVMADNALYGLSWPNLSAFCSLTDPDRR